MIESACAATGSIALAHVKAAVVNADLRFICNFFPARVAATWLRTRRPAVNLTAVIDGACPKNNCALHCRNSGTCLPGQLEVIEPMTVPNTPEMRGFEMCSEASFTTKPPSKASMNDKSESTVTERASLLRERQSTRRHASQGPHSTLLTSQHFRARYRSDASDSLENVLANPKR